MKREIPQSFRRTARQSARQCAAAQSDRLAARRLFSVRWFSAPLLAGVGGCFARSWRLAADPCTSCCSAHCSSTHRYWSCCGSGAGGPALSGAVTLTSCLLVVLPVVYLRRRVSALSQTAYAVLCLLVLATVAMLASVLSRLCIAILETAALGHVGDFSRRRQRPADALPG